MINKNEATYPTVFELKVQEECEIACGPVFSTYENDKTSKADGEFEYKFCDASADAKWDTWQDWESCSVTVGEGLLFFIYI